MIIPISPSGCSSRESTASHLIRHRGRHLDLAAVRGRPILDPVSISEARGPALNSADQWLTTSHAKRAAAERVKVGGWMT